MHPKNRPSSYNPVMEKWFNYSYLANVLAPKPLVYLVRTHDGKYAKMHILSYYCANKSAGCLTFEYVYQGDGSTVWQRPLPQVLRAQETALGLRCGLWGVHCDAQAHNV